MRKRGWRRWPGDCRAPVSGRACSVIRASSAVRSRRSRRLPRACAVGRRPTWSGTAWVALVALEALRRMPDLPVPRLVCLGSPLQGSRTAQWLAGRPRLTPGRWAAAARCCRPAARPGTGASRSAWSPATWSTGSAACSRCWRVLRTAPSGWRRPACRGSPRTAACIAATAALVFSAEAARQVVAFLRTGVFDGVDAGAGERGPV